MPTYSFRNNETQEVFDQFFKSIAAKEEFLVNNPHLQQVHTSSTPTVDPVRLGLRKPDDTFRDILKQVKRNNSTRFNPADGINTF